MKLPHLFHPSTGTFPATARWYLAGITMLGLLSVFMHLSIQSKAQERAVMLVQAWAKQADVHIGSINYHLLRNGLILRNIRIERKFNKLHIEQILMHSSPELLNNPTAHIGKVEISGVEAVYHQRERDHVWQDDPLLMTLWQASTTVSIKNGRLTLYLQEHGAKPLVINTISMQQHTESQQRMITASALMHDGFIQWQWHNNLDTNTSNGQFSWQHVNTQPSYEALDLQPKPGYLNGELEWQTMPLQAEESTSFHIQGELRFESENVDSKEPNAAHQHQPIQRLQFNASQRNKTWDMHINALAWPLDIWRNVLPSINHRQLSAARWHGSSHWQGQPGKWHIKADAGMLTDVVVSGQKNSHADDWSWQQINYDNFDFDLAQHRLRLSHLNMKHGNLTINATDASPSSVASDWNISADQIQLHDMTLNITLAEGNLSLKALAGKAAWPPRQDFNFNIKTAGAKDSIDTQWKLRGKAIRNVMPPFSKANFSMRAKHLPINTLRLLFPIQGDANSPITLTGQMELRSKISVHQGLWRMQGKAVAHDVQVSHAGNTWISKRISSNFGPIGMGLDSQPVQHLESDNWLYIAALAPLQSIHRDQSTMPSSQQTSWWGSVLRDNNIHIDHISLNDGNISMGQQDALWAKKVNIQIDGITESQAANINVEATVGGGNFSLTGDWHALSEPQRFRGTASLQDATPFFLHDWMTASAMPRLIRGRLNADIDIHAGEDKGSYQSQWKLQLQRGLTETATPAPDPMLALSGLATTELLKHLAQADGTVILRDNISGLWQQRPLSFDMIGQSMQVALRQAAKREAPTLKTLETQLIPQPTTHIRLHGKKVLSLNERGRLFKIVRHLHQNPNISIDLIPKWTGQELQPNMLKRIQRTQQLIERYMLHRKISKQRIFPRWPVVSGQVDEISAIQIILND